MIIQTQTLKLLPDSGVFSMMNETRLVITQQKLNNNSLTNNIWFVVSGNSLSMPYFIDLFQYCKAIYKTALYLQFYSLMKCPYIWSQIVIHL